VIDFEAIRKQTCKTMTKYGIPYNENLPLVDLTEFQSSSNAARRLIVLYALAGLAHDADPLKLKNWLVEEGLWKVVLNNERSYFDGHAYNKQEEIDLSWKQESLYILCWAGSLIKKIELPTAECNLEPIFSLVPPEIPTSKFIEEYRIRDQRDIWIQVDLHYCIHAAIKHSELWRDRAYPGDLINEIVLERRHALEWFVDKKQIWDNISLDT
jgi:hypothetical protein